MSDLLYAMNITYPDRHSEGNTSAHLKALVTGNSVNVIIADGKLLLECGREYISANTTDRETGNFMLR